MEQRKQFIADVLHQTASITELCERYGISRKTAYKWIDRYRQDGEAGLADRSRRPHTSPRATDPEVVAAVLETRRRHPAWGADKLLSMLRRRHENWELPSRSTVNDILSRNGMIPAERVRRPLRPSRMPTAANDVWSSVIDTRVRLADGSSCHVLTVCDDFSRYLLTCEALETPQPEAVLAIYERLFREFGLPVRVRSYAVAPFAANTLARLSTLSAWWVRLGILPEWVDPGRDLQLELRREVHEAAAAIGVPVRPLLQRRFNRLRSGFNEDWLPHPLYTPSPRPFPPQIAPLDYPAHFEVRLVSSNGGIRWKSHWVNVAVVLAGENIGFEEFDDGIWNVYFGAYSLGRLDERDMRIRDLHGGALLRCAPSATPLR